MHRLIISTLALATLAACSGRSTGVPERDLQFRTSVRSNEMRVVVFDRTGEYRIDGVSLVGPNGQVFPAREVTRESQGGSTGPGYGVFGSGGSRGMGGIGAQIDIPVGAESTSLERRTAATIALPAGYGQNPAQWHIEVDMTVPNGGPYRASLPVPGS
jgi:hypothetical protein